MKARWRWVVSSSGALGAGVHRSRVRTGHTVLHRGPPQIQGQDFVPGRGLGSREGFLSTLHLEGSSPACLGGMRCWAADLVFKLI